MKSTLNEIIAIIPDFEEFTALVNEIGNLSFQKLITEKEIKQLESGVVREMFLNPQYFQNGKPASMSYIDGTFKYTGLNNEILPLRDKYAEISSALDKKKLQLSVYNNMLDVFRTLSANERKVVM